MLKINSVKVNPDFLLVINNGEFSIELKAFVEQLEYNERIRFENMMKSGDANQLEVCNNDIVWPGWCEIFNSDLEKYIMEG